VRSGPHDDSGHSFGNGIDNHPCGVDWIRRWYKLEDSGVPPAISRSNIHWPLSPYPLDNHKSSSEAAKPLVVLCCHLYRCVLTTAVGPQSFPRKSHQVHGWCFCLRTLVSVCSVWNFEVSGQRWKPSTIDRHTRVW